MSLLTKYRLTPLCWEPFSPLCLLPWSGALPSGRGIYIPLTLKQFIRCSSQLREQRQGKDWLLQRGFTRFTCCLHGGQRPAALKMSCLTQERRLSINRTGDQCHLMAFPQQVRKSLEWTRSKFPTPIPATALLQFMQPRQCAASQNPYVCNIKKGSINCKISRYLCPMLAISPRLGNTASPKSLKCFEPFCRRL